MKRRPQSTHPTRGVRYTLSGGLRNLTDAVALVEDLLDAVEVAEAVVDRVKRVAAEWDATKAVDGRQDLVPLPKVKRADVLCATCGRDWTPGHTCKKASKR